MSSTGCWTILKWKELINKGSFGQTPDSIFFLKTIKTKTGVDNDIGGGRERIFKDAIPLFTSYWQLLPFLAHLFNLQKNLSLNSLRQRKTSKTQQEFEIFDHMSPYYKNQVVNVTCVYEVLTYRWQDSLFHFGLLIVILSPLFSLW